MSAGVRKPGSTARFSPSHADHLPDRTYLLKVPTAYEAVEFEERVEVDGARQRFPLDMARAFQAETRRLVAADPDPAGAIVWLEKVDAWVERLQAAAREVGRQPTPSPEVVAEFWEAARIPDGPDGLTALEEELFERSRTWRTVSVRQRTYRRRRGLTAVNAFLVGWEGEDGLPEFRREGDGVPDELVTEIHPEHLVAIADEVDTLLRPSAATLKNSPWASSGTSSEIPSTPTSLKRPRPNGRSPETPGPAPTSGGETSASTPPTS